VEAAVNFDFRISNFEFRGSGHVDSNRRSPFPAVTLSREDGEGSPDAHAETLRRASPAQGDGGVKARHSGLIDSEFFIRNSKFEILFS
jgi:hypothetical protein